jgi:hypothetical protein
MKADYFVDDRQMIGALSLEKIKIPKHVFEWVDHRLVCWMGGPVGEANLINLKVTVQILSST